MLDLICLDVDGVLADWASAVIRLFDMDPVEVYAKWPEGVSDMHLVLDVTEKEMWGRIDKIGEDFWENLEPYPWAGELLDMCVENAHKLVLATSPGHHHSSASGKVKWMQRRWGWGFRDYMIGPRKDLFARPGVLLVDDFPKNIEKFERGGGEGWLWPAPWNENRGMQAPLDLFHQWLNGVLISKYRLNAEE